MLLYIIFTSSIFFVVVIYDMSHALFQNYTRQHGRGGGIRPVVNLPCSAFGVVAVWA